VSGYSERGGLFFLYSRDPATRQPCVAAVRALLPPIPFAPEEYPIYPTSLQFQFSSKQRILNCQQGSNANRDQRRLEKLSAAAELNETLPHQINKNCLATACNGPVYVCTNTGCNQQAAVPQNGRYYVASYGKTQLIGSTMVDYLVYLYNGNQAEGIQALTVNERNALGFTQTMFNSLQTAQTRATNMGAWWDAIPSGAGVNPDTTWNNLATIIINGVSEQQRFQTETGLGADAYKDIVRLKTNHPVNSQGRDLINDARAALITQAIFSDTALRDWLLGTAGTPGIYRNGAQFDIVSKALIRSNLQAVIQAFPNLDTQPQNTIDNNGNTVLDPLWQQAQWSRELMLAGRVARLHNSGRRSNWNNAAFGNLENNDAGNYVKRYLGIRNWDNPNTTAVESLSYPNEGEYGSMRCAEDLSGRAGLEFRQLVVQ
jgi:hypothetical protein